MLDYPADRLEIQILDDSTDRTSAAVRESVRKHRSRGIQLVHLRRPNRNGFKAGALAHGLERAHGDLIAIFDADFVPPPDFLRRLVGEFDDPEVGMVQAKWGHLNRDSSLLTRVQALQLDAHFTIEHGVRFARRCFFNFNGTAGVWRRAAIETAGGWRADTLTEDLDLSYRAQLNGWRFVYRDDVVAPAELPVEVAAYRQQQQRWAQGGVQTAIAILPRLLRTRLPGGVKREAFWHLAGHFAYPALVTMALAGVSAGWLAGAQYRPWFYGIDGLLLSFATLSLAFYYGTAVRATAGSGWLRRVALVPLVMILGAGISLGQSLAVARAVTGRRTPFLRTPKYRQDEDGDGSWRRASYRIAAPGIALIECSMGATILLMGAATLQQHVAVPPGPILLFGLGFLATGIGSLLQHRRAPKSSAGRRIQSA
jgi:cellulose synthase/poly-beta-1,6-N-acetylglucosamine synthase-like glycosyltransferase